MTQYKHYVFIGNIFIHRNPRLLQSPESGLESCEEEDEIEEAVIYKIGKTCFFKHKLLSLMSEEDVLFHSNSMLVSVSEVHICEATLKLCDIN